MPKTRPSDESKGGVRTPWKTDGELSYAPSRRFPLVGDCNHIDPSAFCRETRCPYHLEYRGYGERRLRPTRDCSLVVASEGEHTVEEVAVILGVSRERVRQIEERALRKLRRVGSLRGGSKDE